MLTESSALPRTARTLRASFGANLKRQVRGYTLTGWMIATVLSPIFLLATAWVIARLIAGGGTPALFEARTGYPSYLSFVVLGLAFNSLALSALEDGGTAIYDEESEGTWDLLALTPMNRFAWMLAKTAAGMVVSLIDFVIVVAVGGLFFGLHVTLASIAVAALGLILTVIALQGFGFLMAALGLIWKQPYALAVILTPAVILLSGMMFPVESLPAWAQAVAQGFPLTHGLHILRHALLLGAGLGALARSFALLLLTGAVFMIVGFTSFRVMERRALRSGGLGRY